jgi:hypothetical protein
MSQEVVMSTTEARGTATNGAGIAHVATKLEVVAIAELSALGADVSDVFHAGEPGAQFREDGTGFALGRAADERPPIGGTHLLDDKRRGPVTGGAFAPTIPGTVPGRPQARRCP